MILVYSKKNIDSFKKWRLTEDDRGGDCVHCSDIDEFHRLIAGGKYSLVVVDFEDALSAVELFDVIKRATGRKSLVILTRLAAQPGDAPKEDSEAELLREGKLILRKKRSASTLQHQDKVSIVSETAATLSHEINNPLMAITANVEMLLKNCRYLDDDVITRIRRIGTAADRIRKATGALTDLDSLSYRNTAAGRMINLEASPQKRDVDLSEVAGLAP